MPSLVKAGLLDAENFRKKAAIEPWTPIMEVADFNSQIALSQEHQVPVYALTPEKIGQTGAVWNKQRLVWRCLRTPSRLAPKRS